MARISDDRYAELLLKLGEADAARAIAHAERASLAAVALWMAEEIRDQADRLRVPRETALRMRAASRRIRDQVTEARRSRRNGAARRAA